MLTLILDLLQLQWPFVRRRGSRLFEPLVAASI